MPDLIIYGRRVKTLYLGGVVIVGALLGWRSGLAAAMLLMLSVISDEQRGTATRSAASGADSGAPAYNGGQSGTYLYHNAGSSAGRSPAGPQSGSSDRSKETTWQGKARKLNEQCERQSGHMSCMYPNKIVSFQPKSLSWLLYARMAVVVVL
eukprot:TRINITY_DN7494_c0_g1_i1.p1 TRINITY_DN7494_c0_g1~~TRINITY_DN7494_c0_g1_i1.p1  ORF type:complete len:152 (-),score=14.87 TRINITY_DN7494_c0_g1_i1:115-570(-)